jgi:small subunit ribosomal protein S4
MSRYTGASCKLCRREGTKLFLKGPKCLTEKCPVERRPYPPGQHGQQTQGRGRKTSEYAKQLREKQKVKRIYGLSESQFRNLFDGVSHEAGVKGTNLLIALETRLDNIVYRLGFASSRKAARQLIGHGHVEVNGKRVDIPSFRVLPGQEIRVAPSSRELVSVHVAQEYASRGQPVSWLNIDTEKASGRLLERPTREAIPINAQEQLIVELYSK